MSLADYDGRVFDLMAFGGVALIGDNLLAEELFGPGSAGQICTGIQKLGQAWVTEFLTPAGSMVFEPDRGTLFIPTFRSGRLRTDADVMSAFMFASIQIRQNFSKVVPTTAPADEQLESATLDRIVISSDQLTLNISIFSVAGLSRKVILPLDVLPTPLQ